MVWELFVYVRTPPRVCEEFFSDYRQSGYDQLVSLFSDYSAPLFFSEYGCNLVQPREFTEVGAICIPTKSEDANFL